MCHKHCSSGITAKYPAIRPDGHMATRLRQLRIYAATRPRGYASTWLRRYASMWLRGYAATRQRGYAATSLRIYVSARIRSYASTWLRRYASMWLRGYAARRQCGYVATRLGGCADTQLRVNMAKRLHACDTQHRFSAALRLRASRLRSYASRARKVPVILVSLQGMNFHLSEQFTSQIQSHYSIRLFHSQITFGLRRYSKPTIWVKLLIAISRVDQLVRSWELRT